MKSMAISSSSSSSIPPISPLHPPHFAPIDEGNEDEELSQGRSSFRTTTPSEYRHNPTPLHHHGSEHRTKGSSKQRPAAAAAAEETTGVLCNKCRPNSRDKFSVVPLENNGVHKLSMASPNWLFKSVLASLGKKTPKSSDSDGGSSAVSREEQWKIAVAELSNKLIKVTKKRDDAILEASKLKYSVAELEKKLNKLEIYCHSLKSGLEECTNSNNASPYQNPKISSSSSPHLSSHLNYECVKIGDQEKVIEHFLVSVSEARSSIRILSRSLTVQLRQVGGKVFDRIAVLLQPYDIKISLSRNPRSLLTFYLEALLNRAFFEDFESIGFQKSSPNKILNPIDRCEANFAMFNSLQGLTWDEVLNKGTRHFSEDFSRFCDRKMSEIVAMLGWNRAWCEPLLQAFFGASKAVWLVHLLANSVHPNLPIFRVEKGVRFDSVYMEDMGGDKAKTLVPTMVRIMVTPGFYVYNNVVKCKVLCRYYNNNIDLNVHKGLMMTPSPT